MPTQFSAATPGALLALVRSSGVVSRQNLLDITGMSRNTLFSRLDQLESAGLITPAGFLKSTGGRPATTFRFNDSGRVVAVLDIGHHRTIVSICHMSGRPLASRRAPRTQDSLSEMVQQLADTAAELLDGLGPANLVGVGVGLPAPVMTHTGTRWPSVALPDADFPILESLAQRFGTLVCTENDGRALALGALEECGPLSQDGVLVGVKYSTGLGIGIVTNDQVMRGVSGMAGDMGHVQITPGSGPLCTCGKRGCLAAYCSGRQYIAELDRPDVKTVTDVAELFAAGNPEVVELVSAGIRLLALQLAALIQVCNPEYVAFGGDLGLNPAIRNLLVQQIHEHVSDRLNPTFKVHSTEGDLTTTKGLVRLVIDKAFSPSRVDEMLS